MASFGVVLDGCFARVDIRIPFRNMGQFATPAEFHQQMPTNQVRQTRTVLNRGVILDRPGRLKFGAQEEITDLFE